MKPNFALTLSFDGIGLLHRIPGGWHMVGDVALDAPDLAGELALLRRKAVALDSAGLRSKLVIPNEQIRYLKLPAPAKGSDIGTHVARMLDGTTPYAVADLRFDWIVVGSDLHIAAVARETLAEAEGFAAEHDFSPVSFVAIPEGEDGFPGEPFFGLTEAADSLIAPGDRLLRDTHPIRVLGRAAPQPSTPQPAAMPLQDAPDDTLPEALPAASISDAPAVGDAVPVQTAQPQPSVPDATLADTAALADTPASDERALDPALPDAEPLAPEPADDAEPLPAFSTRRARDAAPETAALLAAPYTAADTPSAPLSIAPSRITILPDQAPAPRQAPTPDPALRPAAFRSVPASPATNRAGFSDRMALLLSRVTAKTSAIPRPAALISRLRRSTGPWTSWPRPRDTQRLPVLGTPKAAGAAKAARGKPRFLALILTGALLVFMAAVAAWSSIYSDSGFGAFFGPRDSATATLPATAPSPDTTDSIAEPEPQIDLVRLQDGQTLSDLSDDLLPPAAPDTDTDTTTTAAPTTEEALTSYAATGIWQIAPDQPAVAAPGSLDDLYLASIDTRLQNFDAVALPEGRAPTDQRPPAQSSPAAPGTTFDLDPRGLVTATPEGAQTAEGVTVFAGRPPVAPDGMPTRFARTPGVDLDPETETAAQELPVLRPRLRPDTLIESNERAQLGGLSRDELAEVRPRPRPATLAAVALALRDAAPLVDTDPDAEAAADEADALDSATAQAIASSLKPLARPRDFSDTVETSRAAPQQPAPQQAAAATLSAPRNAAPQIPSSASVAQQATVRGAINLRNVNLIGVYGQPSNRRALVRLSNGRYQKVQVGDRLDGGQVRAIGESELSYVKGNRAIVLTMPQG
jgi:hypothetical protein